MKCVGHVASVGERRGAYRVLLGDLREAEHLKDVDVGGRIMLKRIFNK
jgi:hypothetical protein